MRCLCGLDGRVTRLHRDLAVTVIAVPLDTDFRNAGRSIGFYAAGSLAAGIVGFIALPFFTRLFSPEEFGVIGLFTAGVGLLTPTLSLVGFVFVLFDERKGAPSSSVAVATMLISSLGSLILLSGMGLGVALGLISDFPWMPALLGVLTAWSNIWVAVRLHTFQLDQQPAHFFALSAIAPMGAFVLTLILAARIDGWESRIVALAVVAVLAAIWSAWSLDKRARLSIAEGIGRIRVVARFGAPLVVTSATSWIVGFTDRFIVAERVGLADAGVYTVAYALGMGVSSAHDGVARYFVSRLPGSVETEVGSQAAARFAYVYTAVAVLSIPVLIPVALVGLNLLASDAFADASDLLIWLIPAQTLAGVARVFAGYLYVERRTGQRAVLSTGEALFNVALTWFLVGALGTVGAAIATLVTYFAAVIGMYVLARHGDALPSFTRIRFR